MYFQRKRKVADENMKKYNEDDVNYANSKRRMFELRNNIDVGSIERKQLDLCKKRLL